ncbi:hypothetical protein [Helicobacter pylori]|uniref:hypothetical protein n=1 Tax=Helicobacter pylori TaxID=210 RepID=UPI0009A37B3F|nr:hypothetical protein [Helicobacter pylori]OPG56523.1 hypothetical protein BGL85_02825 [Helicobacter pylori]
MFFNLAFYLISLLIACFCLFSGFFGVYCFIVLLFKKKEREGYKPYKRGQKIKIANHINIDQN